MSNYLASKISGLDKRRLKVSLMSLGGAVFGIVLFSFTKNPLFENHVDGPGAEWVSICRFFSLPATCAYLFTAIPWLRNPNGYDPLTVTMKGAGHSFAGMLAALILLIPATKTFGAPLAGIPQVVFFIVTALLKLC
jgi:hypothetical protein